MVPQFWGYTRQEWRTMIPAERESKLMGIIRDIQFVYDVSIGEAVRQLKQEVDECFG